MRVLAERGKGDRQKKLAEGPFAPEELPLCISLPL